MKVVTKTNINEMVKNLEAQGKEIRADLPRILFKILTRIEASAVDNIRSRMRVRTGTLLNSIQKDIKVSRFLIEGSVGPENVPYAAIQEFGGEIPAMFVKPRNVKALRWVQGGKTFFSKGHFIPARKIRAKNYLRDAVNDNLEKAQQDFETFISFILEGNT